MGVPCVTVPPQAIFLKKTAKEKIFFWNCFLCFFFCCFFQKNKCRDAAIHNSAPIWNAYRLILLIWLVVPLLVASSEKLTTREKPNWKKYFIMIIGFFYSEFKKWIPDRKKIKTFPNGLGWFNGSYHSTSKANSTATQIAARRVCAWFL